MKIIFQIKSSLFRKYPENVFLKSAIWSACVDQIVDIKNTILLITGILK